MLHQMTTCVIGNVGTADALAMEFPCRHGPLIARTGLITHMWMGIPAAWA